VGARLQPLWSTSVFNWVVIAAGTTYVLLAGWLMAAAPYDIWGVLVVVPVVAVIGTAIVRRSFSRGFPQLQRAAMVGLLAKLAGTLARYWVANDAYGGLSDSNGYHDAGRLIAGNFHDGYVSIIGLIPHTRGTLFIHELTGFVYTIVGSSKLAGFVWFGLMGYTGVLLCVKAAYIAIPSMHSPNYAWLCFLMPSVVFWPSSVGKEAWMSLTLGMISMGTALLFRGSHALAASGWIAGGAVLSAMVRPHMAAIWLGAMALALAIGLIAGTGLRIHRSRFRTLLVGVVALVAVVMVGKMAVNYLAPGSEDNGSVTQQVSGLLTMTESRTGQGGSAFTPVAVAGPLDYPEAIWRTLTRPLLYEADGLTTLLPALEMTGFVLLLAFSWRRLAAIPRLLTRRPFVLYNLLILVMFGLAFSTFANLALLVRQRSLVMPAMLLMPCVPLRSGAHGQRGPATPAGYLVPAPLPYH